MHFLLQKSLKFTWLSEVLVYKRTKDTIDIFLVVAYSFIVYLNSCFNSIQTEMVNICIYLYSIFFLMIYYHMVFGSPLALITLTALCSILHQ